MSLESTDIDAKLNELSNVVRGIRAEAVSVKISTNRASSSLSQLATTYSDLIASVKEIQDSDDPVDKYHVAKMAKITSEAGALKSKIDYLKSVIDGQL